MKSCSRCGWRSCNQPWQWWWCAAVHEQQAPSSTHAILLGEPHAACCTVRAGLLACQVPGAGGLMHWRRAQQLQCSAAALLLVCQWWSCHCGSRGCKCLKPHTWWGGVLQCAAAAVLRCVRVLVVGGAGGCVGCVEQGWQGGATQAGSCWAALVALMLCVFVCLALYCWPRGGGWAGFECRGGWGAVGCRGV